MPECTLESRENVRDSSKNTNEEDDRKPTQVEKTDQITSNVQLKQRRRFEEGSRSQKEYLENAKDYTYGI